MNIQRSIQLSDKSVRQYWLRGLVKTMIQSGATAGSAFLATAGANAAGIKVTPMDLRGLAVVFCVQAVIAAFNFLKDHPLPEADDIPENVEQAMAAKQEPPQP